MFVVECLWLVLEDYKLLAGFRFVRKRLGALQTSCQQEEVWPDIGELQISKYHRQKLK